jgi:cytochrome P450
MTGMIQTPVRLTRLDIARLLGSALRDPIEATVRNHAQHGPFVVAANALPFLKNARLVALTAAPEFNAEVLLSPAIWKTIGIFPGGPRNSAARRLGAGLSRMTGRRHAYYRKLLINPLQKASVVSLGDRMAELLVEETGAWPVGERFDLWAAVRHLMHTLGIGLLFNDDRKQGYPIADMITQVLALKWSPAMWACPINLPVTPYGQLMRDSEILERCIVDWADSKRGHLDNRDLLSIVVNNPEEDGTPARQETIIGQVPQLFGAAFETCQNVLIWTLVLLSQHPQVAAGLLTELQEKIGDGTLTLDTVTDLPLLDAVIKESLRILPPVPIQMRVAQEDTSLAGYPAPKGARVLLNAFITNRDPRLYPEPDRFKPERWASIAPTPFEYLVFSAGPRNCPGYWLANAMMKLAVATILTQFRIELSAQTRVDYRAWPALSPRGTVEATLIRQDGAFAASPIKGNIINLVGSMPGQRGAKRGR